MSASLANPVDMEQWMLLSETRIVSSVAAGDVIASALAHYIPELNILSVAVSCYCDRARGAGYIRDRRLPDDARYLEDANDRARAVRRALVLIDAWYDVVCAACEMIRSAE